ncbi:hypothetical protein ABEG18_12875 [Alsobacter sp. KACC 23698]|uniref:Uncharacterized protein n=1 Tax=Alsobacter sp. KACC 23698 TaxID=3149229 RepID=A0AAU7JMH1_9HYPH
MRSDAAASTSLFAPAAVETAAATGFFPILLFTTAGLALSVILLFSGLLTVPLESW